MSKDVIGSDIPNYRHRRHRKPDGFGTGKWRYVTANPSTWTLEAERTQHLTTESTTIQTSLMSSWRETVKHMLSSYDVTGHTYAQLTGFSMPEVPQQIFGASVDTVTASSAVLTWSTTVANATAVQYALAGQQPDESSPRWWTVKQEPTMPSHSVDLRSTRRTRP